MTTPVNFRVKNGLTVANGVSVTAGNVVITSGSLVIGGTAVNSSFINTAVDNAYANGVNYTDGKAADAYSNAAFYADAQADDAYTNAVTFAANADNLTSGTLPLARLPATVNVAVALNVANTVNIQVSNVTITNGNDVGTFTSSRLEFTDGLTETGNTYYAAVSHDKLITEKTYSIANVVYADYGEISRTGMFAVVGIDTTNSSIYVKGVTVNTSVISIGNNTTFSLINSTAIVGNGSLLTSVNATTVGGNSALDLRTYTETYASNANNLSTGTVNSARLPAANATTAGAVILVNSTSNTSTTAAASAGSVKTAFDAAGSAYTNAVSYTDSAIGAANTAMVANADAAYTNAIAIAANATNLTSGTVNIARIPTVDAVNNTSISYVASANSVKTAYDAAITANTNAASALANAATAYTNAVAIAANADNLTSGTVNSARLPSGNSTTAGAVVLIDSVSNTSTTAAATAASVKTAYDAAITANTNANTALTAAGAAYTNAVSYTDTKIGTANTAIASNAAAAYTNAISYTDTKIGTANTAMAANAATAYTNAVSYTDTKIGTANTAMVANASAAYTNAIAIAANATNLTSGTVNIARIPTVDAVNNTSITLIPVANNVKTAYDAAITANTNAQAANVKAEAAYTNAVSYIDTKIGTANSAMVANAAAAYSNGVSYTDTRTATAYANAVAFAANASNANNGTLSEPRLPFRMNQNIRTSDSPTFANGTFTGSVTVGGELTVTGNLTTVNVSSLSIADPILKLGTNNAGDALYGGFTFHYSGSGNTTNHAGLIRDPGTKEFFLMSTYGDEGQIGNNQINIADPSFTYANLQVNVLKSGNSTVNTTINSTAMIIGPTFKANSTGLFVGNSTVNTIIGVVPGATSFTTLLTQGNANDSVYSVVTNSNTGSNASADFAIYDSSGVTGTNFIDMGILGTGYSSELWTINGPSDGYLYTSNTNLSIGAAGAKYVSFFAGGSLATNEAMRITSGANVGIGNTNPNAKFQVTGTANVSGAVNFGSTFAAGNTTINGFANVLSGLSLSNGTSNFITWSTAGVDGPSINSRSPGTKLLLYPALSASQSDYAMGIAAATMWSSVPSAEDSFKFKWFGADIDVASISGAGNFRTVGYANVGGTIQGASSLTIAGAASGITTLAAGNTTITGFVNATSSVNSAILSVGTNFVANTTQTTLATNMRINNDKHLRFQTVNSAAATYFVQQSDDNFVMYSTDAAYGARPIWSVYANSSTSSFNISVPVSLSANLIMSNNHITRPVLAGYTEREVANTAATGTWAMDCADANFFDLTLTGSITISPTNVPPSTRMWSGTIVAKQDATGGRTITWPSGIKWPGGVVPPATTTANAIDIWSLMTYDGGSTWIGSLTVKGAA